MVIDTTCILPKEFSEYMTMAHVEARHGVLDFHHCSEETLEEMFRQEAKRLHPNATDADLDSVEAFNEMIYAELQFDRPGTPRPRESYWNEGKRVPLLTDGLHGKVLMDRLDLPKNIARFQKALDERFPEREGALMDTVRLAYARGRETLSIDALSGFLFEYGLFVGLAPALHIEPQAELRIRLVPGGSRVDDHPGFCYVPAIEIVAAVNDRSDKLAYRLVDMASIPAMQLYKMTSVTEKHETVSVP